MDPITEMLLELFALILAIIVNYGLLGFVIYQVGKRLIHYYTECQDQYTRYWEAKQEAKELEEELKRMKNKDWSKEP